LKIVYVKYVDPMGWHKPDMKFYEEDLEYAVLHVQRVAGILIKEDEEKIVLGEVSLAEDNPKLAEFGVEYPHYRYICIIAKTNIIERKEFEI